MAVTGGTGCTLILTEDGNICAFGDNKYGELGVGDNEKHAEPCMLNHADKFDGHEVVMVATATLVSACVTKDGSLWTWGLNPGRKQGGTQEGGGVPDAFHEPRRMCMSLHGNSPVQMVSCQMHFMLILTAAGNIWSIGAGRYYELGHGNLEHCREPKCIDPARFDGVEIGMVCAGGHHCVAVSKTGGRVWTWGNNMWGETGVGDVQGSCVQNPTLIPATQLDGEAVAFASCGTDFTMLVTVSGVLWACGNNSSHECGFDRRTPTHTHLLSKIFRRVGGAEYFGPKGVRTVSCGYDHSMIIAHNNSLWSCGSNIFGELGYESRDSLYNRNTLTLVDSAQFHNHNSEVLSDNEVHIVSAGMCASTVVTAGGDVWVCGKKSNDFLIHCMSKGVWQSARVDLSPQRLFLNEIGDTGGTDCLRAGRWHDVQRQRTTAFAMGLHPSFANNVDYGGTTPYNVNFPDELLREMFQRMRFAVREGSSTSLQILLGIESE